MTKHRTRRRRRTVSALTDLPFWEKPRDRLNVQTPNVYTCAWPGCEEPMVYQLQKDIGPVQSRYGVLCDIHGVDVAIAVVQHQRDSRRMEEFFAQQSTERAIRADEWRREEERYEAEKAALRQGRDGFVYYLRVGERIKVGYSADVKRRMRQYPPTSQLLAVEPGDLALERSRHQQFAGSRADGREWFHPTVDLLEHVEQLVTEHGEPKRFAHHFRKNTQPMRVRRAP